jgi:3D (Asp-Asp-Asp) domain-containing protein
VTDSEDRTSIATPHRHSAVLRGPAEPDLSIVATLGEMVRAGAGYLADLLSRIVNGLTSLVPVLALGGAACNGPKVEPKDKPAAVEHKVIEQEPEEPKELGKFDITFYYVAGEEEVARMTAAKAKKAANDNQEPSGDAELQDDTALAAIAPPETVTIFDPKCNAIADVSRDFAAQIELQGTGKLRDGRVVNIWGKCPCERKPCFKVTENKWGTAGTGKPLQPFRTVAVDRTVIKLGSLLYVPLLEGRTMPGRPPWGGFVHDGCVVADDTGGGINGNQLDLFVGRKGYFLGLSGSRGSHAWARHVSVFDGSKICERKGRKISKKADAI